MAVKEYPVMEQNPWWQPGEAGLGGDERLPDVVTLAPDYGAELPLWGPELAH